MSDVVISYSRADKEKVLPWVERLRAAGMSVWIDEGGIVGGRRWREQIARAIAECRVMILMVSALSVQSEQVGNEVDLAADESKPILPLLLEPVAIPFAWRYALAGRQQIRLSEGDPFPAILRALEEFDVLPDTPHELSTPAKLPVARRASPPPYKGGGRGEVSPSFVNPKDGAEMLYIPPGEFVMGTSEAEIEALLKQYPDLERVLLEDEQPQRTVYLDGYYLAKTPVTVAQYRAFCMATERKMPGLPDGSKDDHPIVNVDWQDAADYCAWAGGRLPTEAEWEKAARGTDGRQWPWGNAWDASKCANSVENRRTGTAAVGSYPSGASPYGCLDMAGNVWEWCADWYGPYDPKATRNPTGPGEGSLRVLRGGSWSFDVTDDFRAALRNGGGPGSRGNDFGFRCVLSEDSF